MFRKTMRKSPVVFARTAAQLFPISRTMLRSSLLLSSDSTLCFHSQWRSNRRYFETSSTRNEKANGDSAPVAPYQIVYESPLGSVVSKLRTVSLATAIIGATGVPCMMALKGAIPEMGMLAVAMMFVTGSIGSTAAIHFVFSPYVYRIESIPVRKCSYKNEETDGISKGEKEMSDSCVDTDSGSVPPSLATKNVLLKAWVRSLLLQHKEIVFDPEIDVEPYSGLRPLCNFRAKEFPLYVHPGTSPCSTHRYLNDQI